MSHILYVHVVGHTIIYVLTRQNCGDFKEYYLKGGKINRLDLLKLSKIKPDKVKVKKAVAKKSKD